MFQKNFTHLSTFNLQSNNNLTEEKLEKVATFAKQEDLKNFKWTQDHQNLLEKLDDLIFQGHDCSQLEDSEIKTLIFEKIMLLEFNHLLYPLLILALFSVNINDTYQKISNASDDFKSFATVMEIGMKFAIEQQEKENN